MAGIWLRRDVMVFLCTIVVVNAAFVAGCASGILPDSFYNYGRFALLGLTMVGVVAVLRGKTGLVRLLDPLRKWRAAPGWYLFALLWPIGATSLFLLTYNMLSTGQIGFSYNTEIITRPGVLISVFIGSLVGEIVWISYATRRLSRDVPVLIAALIVGAFWTAWWLPMTFFNYGIIPGLTPLPLLINQTGVALVCALVYYHTRSGICVLILQFGVNMSILAVPVLPTSGGLATYNKFAVVYFLMALILFIATGPKPLFVRSKRFVVDH